MGVFIDSGFFLGLLHRKDKNHEICKKKFIKISSGRYGLIYTSSFVISETTTLILIRTHNHSATLIAFKELLFGEHKFIRILDSTPQITALSLDIFFAHNQGVNEKRKYLSFVDASNIAFCRENKIEHILAVDGDFDPYLHRL